MIGGGAVGIFHDQTTGSAGSGIVLPVLGTSPAPLEVHCWFLGTMVLLSASAALLIPNWIWQNFVEVVAYPGYNPPGTPGAALGTWLPGIGDRIGWAITGLVILSLIVEWILCTRSKEFRHLLWTFCFTLAAAQWGGYSNGSWKLHCYFSCAGPDLCHV